MNLRLIGDRLDIIFVCIMFLKLDGGMNFYVAVPFYSVVI